MAKYLSPAMTELVATPMQRQLGANRRLVGWWLLSVAVLVLAMVVLGGVTRLTESGLSMVEWRPVTGWLPPMTEHQWLQEFEKYRQFPEYQKVNQGMTLAEFKVIFGFEYAHRLLGRLIGLAFALPLLLFVARKAVDLALAKRLVLIFVLGGLQGGLGWFMVQSGLVDYPDVSHYRLTAHLGMAGLIYAMLLWTAFDVFFPRRGPAPDRERPVRNFSLAVLVLVFLQILLGGLAAGLNAGLIYNTWPLMGATFVPEEILFQSPWWLNFLENRATIQFDHRMMAYLLVAAVIVLMFLGRRAVARLRVRIGLVALCCALLVQLVLGVMTVLLGAPVVVAAAHQAMGFVLFGSSVFVVHQLRAERE